MTVDNNLEKRKILFYLEFPEYSNKLQLVNHLEQNVNELHQLGYVTFVKGKYEITKKGQHYLDEFSSPDEFESFK